MLQSPPQTPPPAPIATPTSTLANDPLEIARQQFIAIASDTVVQSWYAQPLSHDEIARMRRDVLSAGRMKSITLIGRPDARYGAGFAYLFTCEHGSLVERFTVKDRKITSIEFTRK